MAKLAAAIPPVSALPIAEMLESMSQKQWWNELTAAQHTKIKHESSGLVTELVAMGQSRMAIGEHLSAIQEVLEPMGAFTAYVHDYFYFSLRTAYRWIAGWKNAKNNLSDVVLREAMAVGMNIMGESEDKPLGIYTEAVATTPPPRNATPETARKWLVRIDEYRKESHPRTHVETAPKPVSDMEPLLRETYLALRRAVRRIPPGSRGEFVSHIVGMLIGEFSFRVITKPQAVPDDWIKRRGRPRAA